MRFRQDQIKIIVLISIWEVVQLDLNANFTNTYKKMDHNTD